MSLFRAPDFPADSLPGVFEAWARSRFGPVPIAGIDEAGRGPIAGPVHAAAAVLPPGTEIEGLDDSKRLSPARRERLYEEIVRQAAAWSVAARDHAVIDRINILEATKEAMREALGRVLGAASDIGLVAIDGTILLGVHPTEIAVVKGDHFSHNIAAASILAKVSRDREMARLDALHPGYGLAGHKGYPSPAHLAAVARLGPSPIHRRTFAGVREHCR